MIKLAKYLKAFSTSIILAILFLFGQAMCDLNLPNYMSEIVNNGIQQNGILHVAPDAISQKGMKLMTTFMTDKEKEIIFKNYDLKSANDKNSKGKKYISIYKKADQSIYVKKKLNKNVEKQLDQSFGASTWTLFNIIQEEATGKVSHAQTSSKPSSNKINLAKLYELQPMFDKLPKNSILNAHNKAISSDKTLLTQSGIMMTKAFYTELGVNLHKLGSLYIIKIGFIMIAIALLGGIATVLVSFLSSRIASGVARNLRKDVFKKIESFSNNEFDKFSTASLITRCTNDVMQIQTLLMMGIRMLCYAPIMGIGGIIMAINKSASMSWIIALAVIVLLSLIMVIMTVAIPKFKLIQKLIDKLNLVSRENLTGLMVIRAFGNASHEKTRFQEVNSELTKTNLFVNRIMTIMMPSMMLIMNGSSLLIIWVGAHQIAKSNMQVGDMIAFMQYAMQIITAFLMISIMFILVPRAAVSAARISEVLSTNVSIIDPALHKNFEAVKKGFIEFKNVCFRYEGAENDVLNNISFVAKPGQTTAIIGPTGSGKSTIANLILRFYDVTKGEVLVDGVDLREVKQKDLRTKIGYVPQKGLLLTGTIASNLKYGNKNISDEEMERVAQIAQASEFISQKEGDFNAEISQGGDNVSGGQKQRISIARALARKPEILIFDDSFSALDFKTDFTLRKALNEEIESTTMIIIAQRVNTIMNAEHIVVLDNGRIVGQGTHKELLKNCPEYLEIASSQLSKEELA
ncbi:MULTISPECIES: ABC transporter ATP-binding protein [unclassified Bacillus (in: firmicutes)]|uniref:ABC transporter ATP-binding protein n=1 Tax=unclassified Bacillus (in: firmicutes) TaxID=185979 RepID=UPI0008EA5FC9|nr:MULTISPECIES: ABC transporter ATP-binding protein [unclassified Bacillus (in: firmicutes)]PGZ91185.1 ABC transporter ATP-binding protein [Bacillus sp. AFS029533]SFC28013.1 ATP-binding cassette, subfamily B [Bacillus sp. UNCCL81]